MVIAVGERIRKLAEKTGGIKEERIYLGTYEIYRKFVSGSLTIERTTVHISDDTGRIAMLEERTVGSDAAPASLQRYIYSNHLQTASLELDENADIISYEEYHPFGTTAYQASNSAINALAKRYRYTGKERDEETGLYYHGARYYIPWLAVWTAIDPMEAKYAGLSPYNYSMNNPVMLNDPSGADPQTSQGPNSNIPQNNSGVVGSGDGWRAHGDGTFKIDLGIFHNGNKSSGGNGGGNGGGSGNKKAPDKKAPDKKKAAPAQPSSPGGGNGGSGGSPGGTPPPSLINFNIRQVTPIDALDNNLVVGPNPFRKSVNSNLPTDEIKSKIGGFAKKMLEQIHQSEGEYVDNPADPGGKTKLGIAETREWKAAAKFLGMNPDPKNIKNITFDQADRYYIHSRFEPYRIDKINSDKVANAIFDQSILTPGIINRNVKRALNEMGYGFKENSTNLNNAELSALNSVNPNEFVNNFLSKQLEHYESIKRTNPRNYYTHIKGWKNRLNTLRNYK